MPDSSNNEQISQGELIKSTIEHLASSLIVAFPEDPNFGIELIFATTSGIEDEHFTEILAALKIKLTDHEHYKEVSKILTGLREVNKLDKACESYTTQILNKFIKGMKEAQAAKQSKS